jgi:Flp pilus assembly protein TadD
MRTRGALNAIACFRSKQAGRDAAVGKSMLKALAGLFSRPVPPPLPPVRAASTPANAGALLAPAEAARNEGRGDEAIRLLEALLTDHPRAPDAHFLLASLLHERKSYDDARDSYLLASTFAPEWWSPLLGLGILALDDGHYADAVAPLEKALELGASDAQVHAALGAAYLHGGRTEDAVAQLRQALELEPDHVHAHSNLGFALIRDLEQYEEGARHIARAKELAPNDPAILCNWIMALHHTNRWCEALALAEHLLAQDPKLTEARINRALLLLSAGEFARGWPDYEARKELPRNKTGSDVPAAEWNGSSLGRHSVFVYPEQGLGDEIMFASCIPELASASERCTIECHEKLQKIFARSFPAVEVLGKDTWRQSPDSIARSWDYKVAIGSLPKFFRRRGTEFPDHDGYLRADDRRIAHWKQKLAALPGRLKVGISWRGGLASTRRSLRSIPLHQWGTLLCVPDVDFVSLQYSDPEGEASALLAHSGVRLEYWRDAIDDYDETAALVTALDLVISVQTAVVHLAGALGQEAWALIPAAPEWRYGLSGTSMPWYPAVRLFRQTQPGNWKPVLETVTTELAALASRKAQVT